MANFNASKLLLALATICFAVVFVVAGLVGGFDLKDLIPLGLAFFSGAFLVQ